jgi:hypothetical protein
MPRRRFPAPLTAAYRQRGPSVLTVAAYCTFTNVAAAAASVDSETPDNACWRPQNDIYRADVEFQRQRLGGGPPADEPPLPAATTSDVNPKTTAVSVTVDPEPPRLELSFGSTEKFYNQTLYDPAGIVTRRAIPVSTIRPVIDWLFHPDASVWLAFDLPLEPRSELRDDVVVQTYVPPSIMAGARLSVVSVNVLKELWLDLQIDGGLGWSLSRSDENRLFPQLGWRLHLRDQDGFTAYAGSSYEFRMNVAALVYGAGHHF